MSCLVARLRSFPPTICAPDADGCSSDTVFHACNLFCDAARTKICFQFLTHSQHLQIILTDNCETVFYIYIHSYIYSFLHGHIKFRNHFVKKNVQDIISISYTSIINPYMIMSNTYIVCIPMLKRHFVSSYPPAWCKLPYVTFSITCGSLT